MHVFQRQRNSVSDSGSASARARAARPPAGLGRLPCPAHAAHSTKKDFKEIAERAAALLAGATEQIFHIDGALESAAGAPVRRRSEFSSVLPVRAELIVFLAFFVVAQDFVSFLDFFEFLFRLFVVGDSGRDDTFAPAFGTTS